MPTELGTVTEEAKRIADTYGNMLYRVCIVVLENKFDAEDALQDTMIKYLRYHPHFSDSEHEKAWLITVARNTCRDLLRKNQFRRHEDIDECTACYTDKSEKSEVVQALLALPEKYKTVMYLYYVEGYNTSEISNIIKKSRSAVKMRLKKGRDLYKELYTYNRGINL